MSVLSDQGIVGLSFYCSADFFHSSHVEDPQSLSTGLASVLFCLLVRLLIGLDYATVHFSDIHLFYMFILGIFYQQQVRMARKQVFTGLNSPQVVEQ